MINSRWEKDRNDTGLGDADFFVDGATFSFEGIDQGTYDLMIRLTLSVQVAAEKAERKRCMDSVISTLFGAA